MSNGYTSAVMPSVLVTARSAHAMVVGAPVAHHAHRAHRQQHRERLPDRVVQPGRADLLQIDRVGLAQQLQLLARHRRRECGSPGPARGTGAARRSPRGMPSSRPSARTSSLNSSRSGSTSCMRIRSGRPPTLWCALDRHRRPAGEADALDHVRIQRALRQEIRAARSSRASSSNTSMNSRPMVLRLVSGSVTPVQRAEEQLGRVAVHQPDVEAVAERRHHLLRLACAQQAVVDEDAGQLVADRLMDQHRGHRGIHAARQAADHPPLAHLRADAGDLASSRKPAMVQSPGSRRRRG